jgi:hypothetical protein
MQEAVMSKHSTDPKFSPLLWLIPVPFVVASFLPLNIEHPMPVKTERMAVVSTDSESAEAAASQPSPSQADPYRGR